MSQPTLEIHDLSITLGQFALHEVSLSVDAGEYLCIIGPTGAGKTILLECVAGLQEPDRGTVRVYGRDMAEVPPEARNVGYVPQDYALFPHMDVAANIAFGLVEKGVSRDKAAETVRNMGETLRIANLLQRRPATLSGGEQQRVALARALVLNCHLLLLDEPLGALDRVTKDELGEYLRQLHRQFDLTVLHVTHDFDEACDLATRVGVIHAGRMLQTGTPEEVFTRPTTRTVANFVGMPNVWAAAGAQATQSEFLHRVHDEMDTSADGGAWLCVRPDRVAIGDEASSPHAVHAQGVITHVRWRGHSHELVVDVGVPLVASLATPAFERLGAAVGTVVDVAIRPQDVHVLDGE